MKRRSTLPLAAILATLALLLVGCGTEGPNEVVAEAVDDAESQPDAESVPDVISEPRGESAVEPAAAVDAPQGSLRAVLLAETVDRSGSMSSARFEARIDVVAAPGTEPSGPFSMSFAGAFDGPHQASEITIDFGDLVAMATESGSDDSLAPGADEFIGAMAQTFAQPIQVITIGDRSWVKSGLLAMFGIGSDMWLETEGESGAETSAGMGPDGLTSPTDFLETLADAQATVDVVGSEDLRGTMTTHYRADVDLAGLAGQMDPADRVALEAEVGAPSDAGYEVELWIDEQDRLHRMVIRIDEIPPGAESDGLESMLIVYDLWDHGLDIGIVPPPPDQILSEDDLGFGLDELGGFGAAG